MKSLANQTWTLFFFKSFNKFITAVTNKIHIHIIII